MSEDQTVDSITYRIWVAGEKPTARWLRSFSTEGRRPAIGPQKPKRAMKVSKLAAPVENFTIAYDKSESVGILRMDGETTRASVDIAAK